MGKIAESFINWIHSKYEKKGLAWEMSDEITFKFWVTVFPIIVWIPLLFWLLKLLFINYLLNKRGIGEMIAYGIIIMICRPTIMDALTKILTFKNEIKEMKNIQEK